MTGTNEKTTQIVGVEAMDDLIGLFGVFDENLRVIEEETGTRIAATEEGIRIEGGEEMTALTATVLEKCWTCSAVASRSTVRAFAMRWILRGRAMQS